MSKTDINETVKTIRELKRMREELDAEITAAEDLIKAEMNRTQEYTISGDDYKIMWTEVTTQRVDTTALKKALPEVVERFLKTTISRRFSII